MHTFLQFTMIAYALTCYVFACSLRILKSPQDWQTGVALPFVRIQGTTVEWDEYVPLHAYHKLHRLATLLSH